MTGAGSSSGFTLRRHRPGDLGWIVQRHGELYHAEQGWDERFEGLVAEVAARFLAGHDPERERCWIAERDGARLGSVLLVRDEERADVARLRLLLVEPAARGLGLGRRLVHECTVFARAAGHRSIELWTDHALAAARHLYEAEGYRLVRTEPHEHFGAGRLGETWALTLGPR